MASRLAVGGAMRVCGERLVALPCVGIDVAGARPTLDLAVRRGREVQGEECSVAGVAAEGLEERAPVDDSPEAREARAQALVDLVVRLYSPLPAASLGHLVTLLGHGAPHLKTETRAVAKALRKRYAHQELDGIMWLWPADEDPASRRFGIEEDDLSVRLLAPFDPIVWDRRRFEIMWGWAYRFEAYTPAPRRKMGYYALPLLWRDQVIGWGNLRVEQGRLVTELGYVTAPPRSRAFKSALEAELSRMSQFLSL